MPFNFIRSVLDVLAPRPVQCKKSMKEVMGVGSVIEAYNECREKRYIEVERNIQMERKMDLDILITKCKRLLSFVETRGVLQKFDRRMQNFVEKVRQAKYRGDDITPLFQEFENIENNVKKKLQVFRQPKLCGDDRIIVCYKNGPFS